MAVKMCVMMAGLCGVCKACPYDAECRVDCNATHPADAWCERWNAANEWERAKMRRAAAAESRENETASQKGKTI